MASKLKDLSITSVDLVDQGANPDAHIRLFKRKEDGPEQETDPDTGLFEKFTRWLAKRLSVATAWGHEGTETNEQQAAQREDPQSEHDTGSDTPQIKKEVTETMKIDKSKMTPEEQATLAEFEKKYGVADGSGSGTSGTEPAAPENGVEKGAETTPPSAAQPQETGNDLHPDVAKALADFRELTKRQSAEVAELKKSLEVERLTTAAQKYEVLGKKAPELAAKLYELKKAGGTVYDDYVALLDENLTALTKSGLFGEIGSNRQGSAGTVQTLGIKAQELQKAAAGGLTTPDAIVKAWEENPELAAQYEAEYMGR